MSSDDDVRAAIDAVRNMYRERDIPAEEIRRRAREIDPSGIIAEMFPGLLALQAELDRLAAKGSSPATCADLASATRALFAGIADVIRHPNADLSFPPPGKVRPDVNRRGARTSRAKLPKQPRQTPHLREDS